MVKQVVNIDCCPENRERCCPENKAREEKAFGYVFLNDTIAPTVAVGSNLTFNGNGPLRNIIHAVGSDSIVVKVPGIYSINFGIYTFNGNPEGWEVDVNGTNQGVFTADGKAIVASILLDLFACDVITIKNVSTAPDPVTLRSDSITAWARIVKVS